MPRRWLAASLETSRRAGACRCGVRRTGAVVARALWKVAPTTTVIMAPPESVAMSAGSCSTSALPKRLATLAATSFEPVCPSSKKTLVRKKFQFGALAGLPVAGSTTL